jgi:hypothetical protein
VGEEIDSGSEGKARSRKRYKTVATASDENSTFPSTAHSRDGFLVALVAPMIATSSTNTEKINAVIIAPCNGAARTLRRQYKLSAYPYISPYISPSSEKEESPIERNLLGYTDIKCSRRALADRTYKPVYL